LIECLVPRTLANVKRAISSWIMTLPIRRNFEHHFLSPSLRVGMARLLGRRTGDAAQTTKTRGCTTSLDHFHSTTSWLCAAEAFGTRPPMSKNFVAALAR
jgi:hypothetical protein